ncbi:ABC-type transport system involved in multi-copper enzyme maturation permease subunit [Cryobacterium mesophilum]|uniref:ABC-2 type transport system permease protein n=1 Tax=Terrimesophilobacter mesophilus TaxID=433647 RepID=A0A4R8VBY4_9MICO|nr:hypothetical protein [Terrimesophilobacter mesophilus]MBB5633163.1 ABC-type transport system involved in multi-copper enzyme maturation permease subunit [Terrimesophilobacter mesophilus]TFB79916.1 hypothetical protein E3N84_07575 [Terrimesophilobacter mesophilus]
MMLLSVLSGAIAVISVLSPHHPIDPLSAVHTAIMLASVLVQLFAIVVGAEAFAGEFGWGTIGATLAVSPRRGMLFSAKSIATCGTVVVLGLVSGLLAGGTALTVLALMGNAINPMVMMAGLASATGLAVGVGILSLLALALGALTRMRVVAILVPIGVLYILPLAVGLIPQGAVREWASAVLPSTAFTALTTVDPVGALLVLAVWCAAVVPAAVVRFVASDLSAVAAGHPRALRRNPGQQHSDGHPFRSTTGGRLRSELRKSWSLPSVRWIIAIAILLNMAFGIARASLNSVEGVSDNIHDALSIEYSFSITDGIGGIALLLAVLCAIQVASEFETGTAVATFVAAPRRWQVTWMKALLAAISGAAIGVFAVLLTAVVIVPIYAARGYIATPDVVADGLEAGGKAVIFLILISLMSAGIAGATRRSATTVIVMSAALIIGPALFNTILGFSRATDSPLLAVGNVARLFPWEGARFFSPPDGVTDFATIDGSGVLQVSAQFGIMMTAIWAAVALIGWFISDTRRPISVR